MTVTGEGAAGAAGVFSWGFDSPKEKPPPEAAAPNVVPLLSPNLKPEPTELESDCLLSVAFESVAAAAAPNLKPSVAPPNLNPDEPLVSLDGVSDVELPDGTPNVKPPGVEDEEMDSERPAPNLKPPVPEVESNADGVPNFKLPEPEVPKEELKPLGSTMAPGLAVWQATHCMSAVLF